MWQFVIPVTGNYYWCIASPSQTRIKIFKRDKTVYGLHVLIILRLNDPRLKTYAYTKTGTLMFTAASFVITEEWEQPKCPLSILLNE